MANATTIAQKTLRIGVDEPLYVASGGAVNTTGTVGTAPNGTFGIPPQSSIPRGTVWFQSVNRGGTVTALAANLEASFDGGVTWASTQAITFTGGSPSIASANVSGLGGNGTLRLNFTTVTLGTGTGVDIYAHLG